MTEASRFPYLALPFAIVGAAGGWLSANLVSNMHQFRFDLRPPATVTAAIFAALAGALVTRWCRRGYYEYDLLSTEPGARSPADTWWRQTIVVLGAGAASGALVAGAAGVYEWYERGALAGLACAAVFVPVCLSVIAAARRSKRARLGALVSASDRRAVWAILAAALSVATLEALPGWPAAAAGEAPAPVPAVLMLGVSALVITGILVADALGLRRAKNALAPGLVARDPTSLGSADIGAPRLDLGLGEDLAVHVAPAAGAYRGRDRTLSLVHGDPGPTVSAFRRAFLRGGLGLAVVALVACAHLAARSDAALAIFDEQRCEGIGYKNCKRLADAIRETSPLHAMRLYEKACSLTTTESCVGVGEMYTHQCEPHAVLLSPESCVALGEMYLAQDANDNHHSHDRAMEYFGRACRHGDRKGCLYMAH